MLSTIFTSMALFMAEHNAEYPVCPLTVHCLADFGIQSEKFNVFNTNNQSALL